MVIKGDGYMVLVRSVLGGTEPEWLPVEFFMFIATPQGPGYVMFVLKDGDLVAVQGKIDRKGQDNDTSNN